MKSSQILAALSLPNSQYNKTHCSKLAAVYSLLTEIKNDIVISEIVQKNIDFYFGRHTKMVYHNYHGGANIFIENEGNKMLADKFTVLTEKSEYSFAIPVNNAFYASVCSLLGIGYEYKAEPQDSRETLKTIEIEGLFIPSFKKAIKFASKDDLRPAMQAICLSFEKNLCQIVSTDAHKLYLSQKIPCNSGNDKFEILIAEESLKSVSALKTSDKVIIKIIDNESATINGLKVALYDGRYVNYKCVIPEYKTKMQFDRAKLIEGVKVCYPFSNKSTRQVNFHLNGKIELHSEDVDFGFERDFSMEYKTKDFPDSDIAFNGKFLIEILGIFKAKDITMFSAGHKEKAAIFTDGSEQVLLMPLCTNA
jgi:hypothetical protein